MEKFTKKAFRTALRNTDQTEVWRLCSLYLGHKPTRQEVCLTIAKLANTKRDSFKDCLLAYNSLRKRNLIADMHFWHGQNMLGQGKTLHYTQEFYRTEALSMLRRLLTEPIGGYTKVPMLGHTHLYFCSPVYGHRDYNKVMTCELNGNETFVTQILNIANRFLVNRGSIVG